MRSTTDLILFLCQNDSPETISALAAIALEVWDYLSINRWKDGLWSLLFSPDKYYPSHRSDNILEWFLFTGKKYFVVSLKKTVKGKSAVKKDGTSNIFKCATLRKNPNSSANQCREKRLSHLWRLANWHFRPYRIIMKIYWFCWDQEQKGLSGFDVESNARQIAAVYRIFILQQIKFEKNGFHRLVDWKSGF